MKFSTLIHCAVISLLVMVLPCHGFASVRSVSNSNSTTKNPFMMPLRLDHMLGLSKESSEQNDLPRGIVLNAGVGGLVFAGGLMGFVKKGSKASLIAGSTFGGLLMLSAYIIGGKKSSKGNVLGSGVAGLLTYAMGKKFLKSGKFMPAGLIAGLGTVAFVYNLIEAMMKKGSPEKEQKQKS
eukprot:CAMPEP_0119004076 /NCGR_PEP_ID=MMETSP1176-20130426/940_1 /TAXON_ID=265551 /ORGANISM="Synedropsis recta cf, Strain CCMP1620" /LENGTH=180 /DNA_ID=CAMNT_0006955745 /DNA_START=135 /DNA_END=677 /DNA_ORIENTATION=+